ncbi:TetR family transcriptional regulator [Microbacterium awajiense]|uniref:TetR family transcriptional regulator n=1 Tax=Microbacterium awajiense TaxID=415214 RepID=A0ABP7AWA2_9MICO
MADPALPVPRRRRRGRPSGGATDARERILDAAVAEFEAHGYDAATIRSIAARADVDPALVHHYFGSKADLFTAVIDAPMQPARFLPEILDGDLDGAGERLVRFLLDLWEQPDFRRRGIAVMRAMMGSKRTANILVGFVSREILRRITTRLGGGDDARRRAGLVASQIVGLIVTRYVIELPPIAEATPDEVVAAVGPTLQRYLTGDLEG